jgi:hypothetical protein
MKIPSVLFPSGGASLAQVEPAFFRDLNLDHSIKAITAQRDEYELCPFFYTPLDNRDAITFRHEVFQDLESRSLVQHIKHFAEQLRAMRSSLVQADKIYYELQKQAWFLDAVAIYCAAISDLAGGLAQCDLRSRGLQAFQRYLEDYFHSNAFNALTSETTSVKSALGNVKYNVLIREGGFKVRRYDGETDYCAEVERVFQKFKRGEVRNYLGSFSDRPEMNHIESKILEFVALLYPDEFAHLAGYCTRHANYLDEVIKTFDRQAQFYLAYIEHMAWLAEAGLKFCYPAVAQDKGLIYNRDGFDLALANKLVREQSVVVCNDLELRGDERILVITGPNQGGKTTYARTFGQLHYLARLGCPVPGTAAQLYLCDEIFTHFERNERVGTLRGKLEDDLVRIRMILDRATPNSLVIANEAFTSTTVADALYLSTQVLSRLSGRGLVCAWVTFLDELTSLNEKTVSMVATVMPDNPAERTFKLARQPADGLAYAMAIAEKHGVTYNRLKERLKS